MHLPGYKITQPLGRGGMASVYLGQQVSLRRPVAIKVLHARLVKDAFIQRQFRQESLLVAKLNHPNIIQVIDQGVSGDGQPYFIMQYVKSVPLSALISRSDVALMRKLDIVIQICKALSYAHRNGVVHRDIKPANVLVDYEGVVRVVDFGIAGYFERDNVDADKQAFVMGTPAYMAPEQHEPGQGVDHLCDIYALGVVMHELFWACKPQERANAAPLPLAEWQAPLSALVERCISKDRQRRPASADVLRQELLLLLQGRHLNRDNWEKDKSRDAIPAQYRLLDVLKENSYGATYLVNESRRDMLLVVKKQPVGRAARAYQSSQALARKHHPHVATIHGVTKNAEVAIVVMEYIAGGSLEGRLSEAYNLEQWLQMAVEIFSGLEFAHQHHVVHGNLRPSNMLLSTSGEIKLVDFGFADHAHDGRADWYQPSRERKTVASDIYAAAAVLFHVLTGQLVEQADWGIKNGQALDVLPSALRSILKRCLAQNPAHRYHSAAQVGQALRDFSLEQRRVAPGARSGARPRYLRRAVAATAILAVVTALVAQGLWLSGVDLPAMGQQLLDQSERWIGRLQTLRARWH